MRIESLYLFPVKSLAPVKAESFTCVETGPEWDRAWMVVDESGKFVTQRELPLMARIQPELDLSQKTLRLRSLDQPGEEIRAGLNPPVERESVKIWSDACEDAFELSTGMSAWLSQQLGVKLRLVGKKRAREKEGEHARALSFTDDYPLHIASLASLADLNAKLPAGSAPLEMLRFRPNIVVSGTNAWEEDFWKSVHLGEHEFRVGRACTRCAITTVDPSTGARGAEPLKTLADFRRNAKNKIEFGIYLHSVPGAVLRVGDALEVTLKRSAPKE